MFRMVKWLQSETAGLHSVQAASAQAPDLQAEASGMRKWVN